MSRPLFVRLMEGVKIYDNYFVCKEDAIGKGSPVFDRLAHGESPDVHFEINGHQYNKGYYLVDFIYPPCATIVKTIWRTNDENQLRFAKEQKAARKDIKQVFGGLQDRWAIV
ncbi:hypothetical protein QYE76_011071 [Lolium multiflorum]|uniref:Uncharacterized protein n=1 Tax=Lolium multiflorum TaxID=4521 RepID=A0AAD8TYF2_LOLMU|nr:hypothetical protein QYE76_011071 [Lolium multiflorum]